MQKSRADRGQFLLTARETSRGV